MKRLRSLLVFLGTLPACSAGVGSDNVVKCPTEIPLGARSSCNYPETEIYRHYEYGCGYKLPCGERITCTCVPDLARWFCNVDCTNGPSQACEFNVGAYSCPLCSSSSSTQMCIDQQSELIWHS